MVLRKHIALDDEHVRKIQPLINKHNGNLSAAIRDAIDLTTIALQYYESVEDAKSLMTTIKEIHEDQIIMQAPLFNWLLKKTRGLIIDKQTLDYIIDPFTITTIPELEEYINNMCRDFGWEVEIMIDRDKDDFPTYATMIITGNKKERVYFLARILSEYLAIYKNLGDLSVHPQLGEIEIEFKVRPTNAEAIQDVTDNLGYMVNIEKELLTHPRFWKRLINEHSATNYNLVTLHRNFYEELISGKIPNRIQFLEVLDGHSFENMPLSQFLHSIKTVASTTRIVNKVYLEGDNLKILHGYRNMKAVENVKNIFMYMLEANGYNYNSEITNTYIYLIHHPEIEDKTRELFEAFMDNDLDVQRLISEFVNYIRTIKNIDFIEQIKLFGRELGKKLMVYFEQKYGSSYWDLPTFKKAFEPANKQIQSEWELRSSSLKYTVRKCAYADDPKKCHMHREIFKGALSYVFGDSANFDVVKLLSHGDDYCEVNIFEYV